MQKDQNNTELAKSPITPWMMKDVESIKGSQNKAANAKPCDSVIEFVVPVKVMGAPRMTQSDKWKKRPCVVRYREFKDSIREFCPDIPDADKIDSLSWVAEFVTPASWSEKKRKAAIGQLHRSKPDRDNIDKAILDALFEQDQAIAKGSMCKRWSDRDQLIIKIICSPC